MILKNFSLISVFIILIHRSCLLCLKSNVRLCELWEPGCLSLVGSSSYCFSFHKLKIMVSVIWKQRKCKGGGGLWKYSGIFEKECERLELNHSSSCANLFRAKSVCIFAGFCLVCGYPRKANWNDEIITNLLVWSVVIVKSPYEITMHIFVQKRT